MNMDPYSQEFDAVEGTDAPVYKLVGAVLVKQDLAEAKVSVEQRLTFITEKLKSMEEQIKAKTAEQDTVRDKVVALQQARAGAVAAAAAAGAS
jgi:prefoldin beta subunit